MTYETVSPKSIIVSNGASPVSVHAFCGDFGLRGLECDFRAPEAIPYRMVQVSSLYVPSGAVLGQNMFRRKFICLNLVTRSQKDLVAIFRQNSGDAHHNLRPGLGICRQGMGIGRGIRL